MVDLFLCSLFKMELVMDIQALTQITIEDRYARKNIRSRIQKEIESDELLLIRFLLAASSIEKWCKTPSKYNALDEIKQFLLSDEVLLSRKEIVTEIMTTILQHNSRVPVQTVAGIVSGRIGFSDVFTGVKAVAEIIGLMAAEDMFDVYLANDTEEGTMMIDCELSLGDELQQFMAQTKYLPPLIVKPKPVRSNISYQYFTVCESLILGGQVNHHNEKLALDVINILNSQALSIDEEIAEMPEVPNKVLDTYEKQKQFDNMAMASKVVYQEIIEHGNKFYFAHKFDKRGRVYSQGYHINIQSTEYKKALINLHEPVYL